MPPSYISLSEVRRWRVAEKVETLREVVAGRWGPNRNNCCGTIPKALLLCGSQEFLTRTYISYNCSYMYTIVANVWNS